MEENLNLNQNPPDKNNFIQDVNKYYCYIIRSTNPAFSNSTYNGSTNHLTRRLRQHNGEIVGGAKATRGKGPWTYLAIWEGFDSYKEALSCEWRIKHPTGTRKRPGQFNGVKGRIKSLNLLIGLETWTKQNGGMGSNFLNSYNLHVKEELINLIDLTDKKTNLQILPLEI
jgi:predicted GIY-YIG superfamily endonuclease